MLLGHLKGLELRNIVCGYEQNLFTNKSTLIKIKLLRKTLFKVKVI